jgi:hypothetical protein
VGGQSIFEEAIWHHAIRISIALSCTFTRNVYSLTPYPVSRCGKLTTFCKFQGSLLSLALLLLLLLLKSGCSSRQLIEHLFAAFRVREQFGEAEDAIEGYHIQFEKISPRLLCFEGVLAVKKWT